jgi:hypothetical protein
MRVQRRRPVLINQVGPVVLAEAEAVGELLLLRMQDELLGIRVEGQDISRDCEEPATVRKHAV